LWDFNELVLIKSSQNSTYKAKKENCDFILRITPSTHLKKGLIEQELHFVMYLALKGVSICTPVLSIRNNLIESIEEGNIEFSACVFTYAKGEAITASFTWLTDDMFIKAWGKILAKIHCASSEYTPNNPSNSRPRYDEIQHNVLQRGEQILSSITEDYARIALVELKETLHYVQQLPTDKKVYGLIHGDLNHGNFFVKKKNNDK